MSIQWTLLLTALLTLAPLLSAKKISDDKWDDVLPIIQIKELIWHYLMPMITGAVFIAHFYEYLEIDLNHNFHLESSTTGEGRSGVSLEWERDY